MQIVVVLYRPLVLIVNLHDELEILVLVDDVLQPILLEEGHCHEGHLHLATNDLGELEQIEVEGVNPLVETLMFGEQLLSICG